MFTIDRDKEKRITLLTYILRKKLFPIFPTFFSFFHSHVMLI